MSASTAEAGSERAHARDKAAGSWLRALSLTAPIATDPARLLPAVIAEQAHLRGEAPALVADGESLSFRALAERADLYARWALRTGVRKGDVVALLMPNRPEYMAIWLGISSVGGIVALVNTNLVGRSLAHCIAVAAPTHIIVAAELLDVFAQAQAHLSAEATVWSHGAAPTQGGGLPDILRTLDSPGAPVQQPQRPDVTTADCALYIYTSGTTGLPKAARISHGRLLMWSFWFAGMMDAGPQDRMYNCLPMYHSIGGVVATGAMLVSGGSVAIRDKFSTREFWDDIVRFDCTLFQYIGELGRYLANSPPHPRERAHRLRLCCGNGLRGDVWPAFQQRFRIPQILEFYAATEGNVTLFNVEGKPGAIGRIPAFLAHRWPTALVTCDPETGSPLRDAQGFCIRCGPDEIGEALGKIAATPASASRYEGYTSREESERKILRDVFARGDTWFRTGDLMRKDRAGYFYFVDRIGDTFRWKGENVATAEVGEAIAAFPGVRDVAVYGVPIPGHDGRAGMAAVAAEALDVAALHAHLAARLPVYARPLFLRVRADIEITATFKRQTGNLVREGYDAAATSDPIYVYDAMQAAYVRLDAATHRRIAQGDMRF